MRANCLRVIFALFSVSTLRAGQRTHQDFGRYPRTHPQKLTCPKTCAEIHLWKSAEGRHFHCLWTACGKSPNLAPKSKDPEGRFGYGSTFRIPTLMGLCFARVPNLLASHPLLAKFRAGPKIPRATLATETSNTLYCTWLAKGRNFGEDCETEREISAVSLVRFDRREF